MTELDFLVQSEWDFHEVVRFLIDPEAIMKIRGPVHEQGGTGDAREIHGRIKQVAPAFGLFRPKLLELCEPCAVFPEEAAARDRDGAFQAVIHTGDNTGEVTAPTDSGDADAVRIHFRQTAQE